VKRKMDDDGKVAVLGAGLMGAEIALCFARSGISTLLKDVDIPTAQRGKERVCRLLDKSVTKGKITREEMDEVLGRIEIANDYGSFDNVDLVIEAVIEDSRIKRVLLAEAARACRDDTILATNTSSISITELSSSLEKHHPERFLGLHFFSPASAMELVELIPGLDTSQETIDSAAGWMQRIGKTAVRVKDVPGFVINRLLHVMWIEAQRLVEEEVARPEDIDVACRLGLGHPIGPFSLMDHVSNDLILTVEQILCEAYGERFRPRPVLKQRVAANHLGRKAGRGWFVYE
jgi:3-hydroxybutyryl-CoA dehydrogenase